MSSCLKEIVPSSPTLYESKTISEFNQDCTYVLIDKQLVSKENHPSWNAGNILLLKPWKQDKGTKYWIFIDMFYPWHKCFHMDDSLSDNIISAKALQDNICHLYSRFHIIEMDFTSPDSSHIPDYNRNCIQMIRDILNKIINVVK